MAKKSKAKKMSMKAGKVRKAAKNTGGRTARKAKVSPIPKGYATLTPYLVCRGAANAIEFYKKAFDAKEKGRMLGPGGSIMHAELTIGNSPVMMGEEMPERGAMSPQALGGSATGLHIYTTDVDKLFARAVAAGATVEMPPSDMFWGDRYAKVVDPFGHKWSIATHTEDLSTKEMQKRGDAAMAEMAAQAQKA